MRRRQQKRNIPFFEITAMVLFSLFILLAAINLPLMKTPLENLKKNRDFKAFTQEVQAVYTSDKLEGKNPLINVNGAFARLTNRHIYNEVVLLNNGYLGAMDTGKTDMQPRADKLAELSRYLENEGTEFLFVQAGKKIDLANELLPLGEKNHFNENANDLLNMLAKENVRTLDLRPFLNGNPEQVSRYYFKTDHHWNYEGAFYAFQLIMQEMNRIFPDSPLDLAYTDESMWQKHLLKNHFLGSNGKRVGIFYAGTDDVVYYTPEFDTWMSCIVPVHNRITKGVFQDAVMRSEYFERTDYFETIPYCMYIGGDYPLVQHRNAEAPNKQKILIVKDSFVLPVQSFMSTLFSEIDVIDLRHFTEETLAEYIEKNDFDLVMYLLSGTIISKEYFDRIGDLKAVPEKTETLLYEADAVSVKKSNTKYNYKKINVSLEAGKEYVLRFTNVDIQEGTTHGIGIRLYDSKANAPVRTFTHDIEYGNANDGCEWRFTVPEKAGNELQLLLYAGIPGGTAGISLTYHNVSLSVCE